MYKIIFINICIVISDDDECQMENGGCEHTCENLVGSYICNCFDGYRLNGDRRNCDGNHFTLIL
jgi:hypothetical protein